MVEYKRIKIEYSDGVAGSAPPHKASLPPKSGSFDYYRSLDTNEIKWARWLKTLGAVLKSETALKENPHEYALADFPENYTLLEHNKYQGEGKKPRTDMYLYGHPSGSRFRSINEFIPHMLWLAKDKQHSPKTCGCKYCPGSGTAPMTSRSRSGKVKPVYTGMSEMGRTQMERASTEAERDLHEYAPVYRIGEVVVKDGHQYIVADSIGEDDPRTLAKALENHTYTLLDVESPHQRLEQVPHAQISPRLAKSNVDTTIEHEVSRSASPIAKFSLQPTATQPTGLPGPCYVGWYLGPEKIYRNDLVRLTPVSNSGAQDILLISHIILDVSANTIKVRGDIFQITDEVVDLSDELREIPATLLDIAKTSGKYVRYVNTPGLEFDIVMADVLGRFYHPSAFSEPLASNQISQVVKGRVSTLPKELVSVINHVFDEIEEDQTIKIGERSAPGAEEAASHESNAGAQVPSITASPTIQQEDDNSLPEGMTSVANGMADQAEHVIDPLLQDIEAEVEVECPPPAKRALVDETETRPRKKATIEAPTTSIVTDDINITNDTPLQVEQMHAVV
ncbi:Cryptic loci regulator 2 [Taphrina deformans PYCC 5710]|uniref:Cryptic loci regulator 2 n=1 Tax=Taphrina deformans (strain PYCC 5710 / ATCC 11124 / CBS 356.35 / IMI 108563 / JCM 9778 / NBRC 8474) TaxID=1097556 RepID=R4XBL7_TAPDE|nr:Cryptic loci regulator 2 [Taphrina deformans PYCC 5710]|eukprot:CCG83178.1 Cryptic loci regulator 2 [Taphrina deformans PYCC 5710]